MAQVWPQIVGGVAMVAGAAVGFYLMRNRIPLSPRQAYRQNGWSSLLTVVAMLALAGVNWSQGHTGLTVVFGVITLLGLVGLLHAYLRTPKAIEELQNFAAEPGRCGRCEYDLTGNLSGVCPECGWKIPRGELDVDSPGWALWWRRWEIGHLRNWRRMLVFQVAMAGVFVAMAVVMGIFLGLTAVVMPAAMGANFGINVWRVVVYGRKHR